MGISANKWPLYRTKKRHLNDAVFPNCHCEHGCYMHYALRITHYALRITHYANGQPPRMPFQALGLHLSADRIAFYRLALSLHR